MADRLRHVLRALNSPWAITPDGFETVCAIIDRRAAGIRLSDDEIRAIVDDSRAEFEAKHEAATFGKTAQADASVAVISLYGTILPRPVTDISGGGGAPLTRFMDMFQQADADPNVRHILLDIDSPGGSAAMVAEAATMIRSAQTPTTAIANTMAASAAYWLASQADELVVSPSGFVGSVGVFARHVDESVALANEGIKVTLVSAGDHKTEGNPYEPLSDDARAYIQAQVDEVYAAFVEAVAAGRNVSTDEVEAGFGQGRMFSAQAAVANGMADSVATFGETVQRLLTRGGSRTPAQMRAEQAEWVKLHGGSDARISGECVCGREMSGDPEDGEYAYYGGSHGFYACAGCGREWKTAGNGIMVPKDSPVTADTRASGPEKPAPVDGRVARLLNGR